MYERLLKIAREKYKKDSYYLTQSGVKQKITGEIKWDTKLTSIRCTGGLGILYDLKTNKWAELC